MAFTWVHVNETEHLPCVFIEILKIEIRKKKSKSKADQYLYYNLRCTYICVRVDKCIGLILKHSTATHIFTLLSYKVCKKGLDHESENARLKMSTLYTR